MQEFFPTLVVGSGTRDGAKRFANDTVGRDGCFATQAGQHFQIGHPIEQRRDEWLDGNDCAVTGPRVTPGFEIMRLRQEQVCA